MADSRTKAQRPRLVGMDTPAKRARLAARKNPYWQPCGPQRGGLCIGYRKPTEGAGAWIARLIRDGRREERRLGAADDADAPAGALSYAAAVTAALEWFNRRRAALSGPALTDGPITVRQAVESYIAARIARDPDAGADAAHRLRRHVLASPLAAKALANVTERDFAEWRRGLKRGGRPALRILSRTPAGKDASPTLPPLAPATVNRLLNDLRAALNAAVEQHWRTLPPTVAKVIEVGLRGIENAETPRAVQVLSDADVRRLVDAAWAVDPDFGALVTVLAATGARFSQAAAITVADVQPDRLRIMVPPSAKGRGGKKPPRIAVQLDSVTMARLLPLGYGRTGSEPLLMRWHRVQVGYDRTTRRPIWQQAERRPWSDAAEMTRPWAEALHHAGLPAGIIPYALRHSSIVRGLRAGLPVRLVAALHDTSTVMIERHYSAWIVDATEELARRAALPLDPAAAVPLRAVS